MSTSTRLTVEQFDRMIAEGYFETRGPRQRIELIEGELRTMSPIGPPHESVVDFLNRWSTSVVSGKPVTVRVQNSIGIDEIESAPEPDIVWVERRSYRSRRPSAGNVLLIIEVADSSLAYDCGAKANLYAAGGIADYWVVDIPGECLHVYRQPQAGRFTVHETLHAADTVSPLSFPEIRLQVASLFAADDVEE